MIKLGKVSEQTKGIKDDGPLEPNLVDQVFDTP